MSSTVVGYGKLHFPGKSYGICGISPLVLSLDLVVVNIKMRNMRDIGHVGDSRKVSLTAQANIILQVNATYDAHTSVTLKISKQPTSPHLSCSPNKRFNDMGRKVKEKKSFINKPVVQLETNNNQPVTRIPIAVPVQKHCVAFSRTVCLPSYTVTAYSDTHVNNMNNVTYSRRTNTILMS